jgi:hypothetical protein
MLKISTTLGEISDYYNWKKFCELREWSVWCIKAGTAAYDTKVELTMEEAKEIGIDIFK